MQQLFTPITQDKALEQYMYNKLKIEKAKKKLSKI